MDEHGIARLPKPADLAPLARDEFVSGFDAAMRADAQRVSDAHAERSAATCEDVERTLAFPLADYPMYRALLAARNHFGKRVAVFQNFMFRFCALIDLVHTNTFRNWTREISGPGDQTIHPAVIYACADVQLTENGRFPVDQFLQRTRQIIDEEFHP